MSAAIVPINDPSPLQRLQGRVDAIEGGRILGWAWHADHPTERLTIEALHDGKLIAKVSADRPRIDLRRNGIGDGAYAFDFQIDGTLPELRQKLTVQAITTGGEVLPLRVPSPDERAAEAAVAIPLARVLERIELLIAAQRQTQLGQRDTGVSMRDMAQRIDALSGEEGQIVKGVGQVAAAQADLAERVSAIEVFLTRFDVTLGAFDGRLRELQKVGRSDAKPLLIVAGTLIGVIAGAVLTLLVLR